MEKEKIYIVVENSVWDDEEYNKIILATTSKKLAQEELKKYIEHVKSEVDYDELEFSEDEISDGFIVEEDDNSFSLYDNGEYNSFHVEISIIATDLIKELTNEKEL